MIIIELLLSIYIYADSQQSCSKAVQHWSMYAQACRLNLQGASEIPNFSRSVPTALGNEIRKGCAKATGRIGVEQNVNIAFMQHIHNSCVY
jgi:hypothetical protein